MLIKIKTLPLVLVLLLITSQAKAQSYFEPKMSFSVDLGIPAKGHNESFSRVMEGLFNGGVTLQRNMFNGLTAGIGVKYSFFTLNPFSLNNVNWGGSMHFP